LSGEEQFCAIKDDMEKLMGETISTKEDCLIEIIQNVNFK
jgi:hypothetical protein